MKTSKRLTRVMGAILLGMVALSLASCGKNGGTVDVEKLKKGKPAPETDFETELTEEGNGVIITKYKGSAKNVVIPATIQGLPVVEVGGFSSVCHEIKDGAAKTVVIPEGVQFIRREGFFGLENLETVVFPSSLRVIGEEAFKKCTNLKNAALNEGLIGIGEEAFADTDISSVALPKSLRFLDRLVWAGCNNLSEINIPDGHSVVYVDMGLDLFTDICGSHSFEEFFSGTKINETVALQKLLRDNKTIEPSLELEMKLIKEKYRDLTLWQ
ncbi:MAG: leucine-rich repeat domain-containing protein [Treponema sp.]|nr:leucine-rich repeat domain-containing protein [Treponema sp.]MBR6143571.1 leucine-rich repeat domain-containing protein [Treponema sp.]